MNTPEKVRQLVEKRLEREKRNLSIFLLQQLVKTLKQNNLRTDFDIYTSGTQETVVSAQTPDNKYLYEIRYIRNTNDYIISINNGKHLVSFGQDNDNCTCFKDEKHNYLQALYNLTFYGPANIPAETKEIIDNLESKKVKPTMGCTLVWPENRMSVFSHLNKYISR